MVPRGGGKIADWANLISDGDHLRVISPNSSESVSQHVVNLALEVACRIAL
jgi:hypothetical protein